MTSYTTNTAGDPYYFDTGGTTSVNPFTLSTSTSADIHIEWAESKPNVVSCRDGIYMVFGPLSVQRPRMDQFRLV